MKSKLKRKIFLLTVVVFTLCLQPFITKTVHASPATSYTMTINSKDRFVRTQDAYLPERTIVDLNLSSPSDMYFDANDHMFIADTDNQRIVKYNPDIDEVLMIIEHDEFKKPKGVFVTKDNEIYVTDSAAQLIFKFDQNGQLIEKFDKPTAAAFEGTTFDPSKIGVDNRGNMFVYLEGVGDGIIQLSKSGEFLGFFTSNAVNLDLSQRVQNMLLTQDQIDRFFPKRTINFFECIC